LRVEGDIRSRSGCCGLGFGLPHLVSSCLLGYSFQQFRPYAPSKRECILGLRRGSTGCNRNRSTPLPSWSPASVYGNVPSVKELIASFRCGFCARYFSVTSGSPSLIIRCIMIKLLNTIVHVESRSRFVRARNISATPASPACVATKICSTYFDFGAASYTCVSVGLSWTLARVWHCDTKPEGERMPTLILVPPFTLFSNELAMSP
jgi:hypothetical protein